MAEIDPGEVLVSAHVKKALDILNRDEDRLARIDRYIHGEHDDPYMPDSATGEYRRLAQRSVTNLCELVVHTPSQALYVDHFRRTGDTGDKTRLGAEMTHWQDSRLDQRQVYVHDAAVGFGYSGVLTERNKDGKVVSGGLSPLRTVFLYEDASLDLDPVAVVYIRRWGDTLKGKPTEFWYWNDQDRITGVVDKNGRVAVKKVEKHGASECPVTPFYAYRDLDGRAWGVVEPLIPLQDRINQTIFDLLVAQTYTSFEVRTVTGMAPPMRMTKNADGEMEPVLDAEGKPVPDRQYLNASRWFYAADADVKFGSLPGGELHGFIEAAETAIRHLSAISQTPPHFLLGQIANVSAEALEAAETALTRKIESFRTTFGESWERVFRIAAQIDGTEGASDYSGEVIWRDFGISSIAQTADGLGKLATQLSIPGEALWPRVPGVTSGELAHWKKIQDEGDKELQVTNALIGRGVDAARVQE